MNSSEKQFYPPIPDTLNGNTLKKFQKLASFYAPEFRFDALRPDPASALGIIYCAMAQDTAERLNSIMLKHRTELVNTIGINLKSAHPARAIVCFALNPASDEGSFLKKGTSLSADAVDGGEPLIFRTLESIYLTSAKITDIYCTSLHHAKIISCYEYDESSPDSAIPPMELFDFGDNAKNMERHCLRFSHPNIDCVENELRLKVLPKGESPENTETMLDFFADDEKTEWRLMLGEETFSFNDVRRDKNGVFLTKSLKDMPAAGENSYLIEAVVKNPKTLPHFRLCALNLYMQKEHLQASHVYRPDMELNSEEFMPFGENISMFSECYFSMRELLQQEGAWASLKFNVSFQRISHKPEEPVEAEELRLIMRRPKLRPYYQPVEIRADEIVLEYWNGTNWTVLPTENDIGTMLNGEKSGDAEVRFTVPCCRRITIGAYEDYWLRLRVIRCENAFKIPNNTIAPVISGLRGEYRYPDGGLPPYSIDAVNNSHTRSLLYELENGRPDMLFFNDSYEKPCIYFGFDGKLDNSPISIFLDIRESVEEKLPALSFEYGAVYNKGLQFNLLKAVDNTEHLRKAGLFMFIVPQDFCKTTLFGKERYWLRIVNADGAYDGGEYPPVKVKGIYINAVEAENTREFTESFYNDHYEPNHEIRLAQTNIMDIHLWVNEAEKLSLQEMEEMLETGKTCRAERDELGRITSFWIEWTEVENFYRSNPQDRHFIIDRASGRVVFGDDFKGKSVPSSRSEAIIAEYTICDGGRGNVPAGAINRSDEAIRFVSEISNPIAAYGGHDFENAERAVQRGLNLIVNRGRAVTQTDYEAMLLNYSQDIVRIKSMHRGNCLQIALLLRDYYKGPHVFQRFKKPLEQYINSVSCSDIMNIELRIAEPVFVYIDTTVWIHLNRLEDAFMLQTKIREEIEKFLDPVSGNFGGIGWEISQIPQEMQLISYLKSLKLNGEISSVVMTGRVDLDENALQKDIKAFLSKDELYIGVSGKHNVIIEM